MRVCERVRETQWILAIVCLPALSFAQTFKDRVTLMQMEYSEMNNLHVIMKIEAFENDKSSTPFYTESASVKREGENYLNKIGGTEILMNDKYLLMVDKNSKQIVYTKRDVKSEARFTDPIKLNLDSILGFYGTPILVKSESNIEHYRLDQKNGAIKVVHVYINTDKNILNRIDYQYENGQFVVIRFELFETSPKFEKNEFNESNYIVWEKDKLKPSPKFSKFNVVVN